MKTKVIDLGYWGNGKLKILMGGDHDDAMCIAFSCSKENIPSTARIKSTGKKGSCCLIKDPQKDPDGADILVWLNVDYINNCWRGEDTVEDVLLHELVHVKQRMMDNMLKDSEKLPDEIEARIITDLFQRAKKAIKED